MFKTLRARFIFYTAIYTLLLVFILYAVQRFGAPNLYVRSVLESERSLAEEVVLNITDDPTFNELARLNTRTASEITLYDANGQIIFGEGTSLIPLDVVRSFQELTWHRFTRNQDQTVLELFYVSDNLIIRLKSPFAPIISNLNFLDRLFITMGLIAVFLAIPLSYFFAQSFTKPVVKIKKLAQDFSDLRFETELHLNRSDELKALETSLKSMAIKLKNTLNDLQSELAKEKALDQIQKDFVARVSHELKTPLAIIKNSVETLFESVNESLPLDLKTMIDEEIDHMVALSHDLIDLSQLESGRFTIQKRLTSMNQLTEEVLKPFQLKNVIVKGDAPLEVEVDPKRIRQVFQNLIQNSVFYQTPKSSIEITLDGTYKTWSITNQTDQDIKVDQLFKPFYKGEEKSPGSGLGLAIVKSILIAHGATIEVTQASSKITFEIQFDAD